MEPIIAYCGLVCSECGAYLATQADDLAALEQVAAEWRQAYGHPEMTAEMVRCDGCLGTEGRKVGHCFECEVRLCALERDALNCAHCLDYGCDKIEGFFGFVPDARTTLDRIRAGLRA
jgi:hypothetical protein